jgi:hypothetical protein
LENDALALLLSIAPMVLAAATRAGEVLAALTLLFPAAMVKWSPPEIAVETALSIVVDALPPRDIVATNRGI